jgi:Putative bacterial sensory transduction regulator
MTPFSHLFRCGLVLSFAVAAGLARPVSAQDLVTADNPEKILEIARGFGSAEMETDSDGSPRIRARMDGTLYTVFFYGCEDGKDCTTIQFWMFTDAPPNALVVVNDWNRDRRFGKAYIDKDGDVVIEMDVNLLGGVSAKNLDDTFDWWRIVLERAGEEFPDAQSTPVAPDPGIVGKTL